MDNSLNIETFLVLNAVSWQSSYTLFEYELTMKRFFLNFAIKRSEAQLANKWSS